MSLTWEVRAPTRPHRRASVATEGALLFSVWENEDHEAGFQVSYRMTQGTFWHKAWMTGEALTFDEAKAKAEKILPALKILLDAGMSPST